MKSIKVDGVCSTQHPLYGVWCAMRRRCNYVKDTRYNVYGGKGITVCDEWKSFVNFHSWAVANGYQHLPENGRNTLSIDRIDVTKGYSPNNCRWTDNVTQGNNRSNNHRLTFQGETLTIAEWERKLGLSAGIVLQRVLKLGHDADKALSMPRNSFYVHLTYNGITLTQKEWARRLGLSPSEISRRKRKGYPIEKILMEERNNEN